MVGRKHGSHAVIQPWAHEIKQGHENEPTRPLIGTLRLSQGRGQTKKPYVRVMLYHRKTHEGEKVGHGHRETQPKAIFRH